MSNKMTVFLKDLRLIKKMEKIICLLDALKAALTVFTLMFAACRIVLMFCKSE